MYCLLIFVEPTEVEVRLRDPNDIRPSVTLTKTELLSNPASVVLTKLGWYLPYVGLHDILGSKVT